jgi:hypothetical protein
MISREPFGLEAILRHIDKGHATIHGATVLAKRYREIRKKVASWCESAAKANARADRLAAEVERLRMTQEEREALSFAAVSAEDRGAFDRADAIRGLQARHARETVGG